MGSLVANGVMKKEAIKLLCLPDIDLRYCFSSRVGLPDVSIIKAVRLPFYFKLRRAALEGKEIFRSSR